MKKTIENTHFDIHSTVQRFLVYKITENLRMIGLDINDQKKEVSLTAYYKNKPSDLELELLDDINTNSSAHLPHHIVVTSVKYGITDLSNVEHESIPFSFYEEY